MDQSLQIEAITADGQCIAPAVDAAAALAALGWNLHYKKQELRSEGSRLEHAWCIHDRLSEAQDILRRAAVPSGPESLIHRAPEHPFLAALFGIRALRVLTSWCADPAHPPVAVKPTAAGRLCTLNPSHQTVGRGCRRADNNSSAQADNNSDANDLIPLVWLTQPPSDDVAITTAESAAFCAAAIVVGFLPHPQLTGPDVPHVHFPATSFTFPGLDLKHFHQPELPGTPDSAAHPFRTALHACLRWQACLTREEKERRLTVLLRAQRGPGTAIVSNALLDTEDPRFAKDRDKIALHLAFA